ncbi:MAG: copper chaperone PCu(A)C [Gemmatimonadetes bacterium]|nr:copper chaperone PCu(A)C [Gemmatimonadota bacterium]
MTAIASTSLRGIAAFLGVTLIPAIALSAQAATVTVRDVWVREAAAGRPTTAAFLILENKGDAVRALIRGTASVGDTLELHEMKRDNGMMRMSPVARIEIPAHGEVALRPGGLHLMIFGLKAPLTVGDTVALTLTFDDGKTLSLKAPVRAMQGMP